MLKTSIKQRQVVAFYKALREMQGDGKLSVPEYNDCVVKAAIKAEMLDGLTQTTAVDEMDPKEANALAKEVADYLVDLLKIDPN
jgi:hypothetical protein